MALSSKNKFQGGSNLFLALRLKGCEGHMTIAWLSNTVDPNLVYEDMKNAMPILFDSTENPFSITLFSYDAHFGPNEDIPVYICTIKDEKKKQIILDLWKKYNVEQEHTKGLKNPNLHVKSRGLPKTANVGQSYEVSAIFIEEVGKEGKVIHCIQI